MEPGDIQSLVGRVQQGNYEQFAQLFDLFQNKIYQFVYFRTHHKQTAEDITSTVFMKALESIQNYKSGKALFSTWLYQIARNSVIDYYRTVKENSNIEDAWGIPSSSNIERDADVARSLEKVKEHLKTLPAQQRDVVIMRVWDGLSHKEIAEVLGTSEANSKMMFSRATAKINNEVLVAMVLTFISMSSLKS